MDFVAFPKIPRLMRDVTVSEKIDGTNAQVLIRHALDGVYDPEYDYITDSLMIRAGSRTRWIRPGKTSDNFGFAAWVHQNAADLAALGPGAHFGEWWGHGIGRGYGLNAHDRRWSLFNTERWTIDNVPDCCDVVPVMFKGPFDMNAIETCVNALRHGSIAAPGFRRPEGIVVYHTAANQMFKRTIEKDDAPKGVTS